MKLKKKKKFSPWKKSYGQPRQHIKQQRHYFANRGPSIQSYENNGNSDRLFWGAPKSLWMVTAAMKLKDACSLEEKL